MSLRQINSRTVTSRLVSSKAALLIAVTLVLSAANTYADWEATDTGALAEGAAATAMSADGRTIIGRWTTASHENHAFKYADGVMTDLPRLVGVVAPLLHDTA